MDPSDLSIKLFLNNEKKQDSRTSKMIFNIPAIIESLSLGFTLNPGDIILTGTPDGKKKILNKCVISYYF